jgi:hypothetical protein
MLMLAIGLSMAAPACAAQARYYGGQPDYREIERRAYDAGYRQGFSNGERDARDRRDFRVDRGQDYRDADRSWRDRDRRFFRDGYQAGYTEGYQRVARDDRRGGFRAPDNRGNPEGRFSSPAAQVGYRDGLEAGRNDASDRHRYDPRQSKRYREGDRDYDRRYGSLDQYKLDYRAAFMQGYDVGYQGYRR